MIIKIIIIIAISLWASIAHGDVAMTPTLDSVVYHTGSPWSVGISWWADSSDVFDLAWVKGYIDTDTAVYNGTMTDSVNAIDRNSHGITIFNGLTGDTKYYYRIGAWFGGAGETTWTALDSFTTVDGTGVSADIPTDTALYVCDDDDYYYRLLGDKNASWSGIENANGNIFIDLCGHTLTYGNLVEDIEIPNGSFEVADTDTFQAADWTFSNNTYIKRKWGTYYRYSSTNLPDVSDSNYSIKMIIQETDTNLYVTTDDNVTIPFGGVGGDSLTANMYVATIMCYAYPIDLGSDVWDDLTVHFEYLVDSDTINWTNNHEPWVNWPNQKPWRSFAYGSSGSIQKRGTQLMHFMFPVYNRPYNGKFRFGVHGYNEYCDSIMFDDPTITQANYYGIFSPYHTLWADSIYMFPPAAYTRCNDVSGGVAGATIFNGTIKHGNSSKAPYWCHPIYSFNSVDADNWNIVAVNIEYRGTNVTGINRRTCDLDTIVYCTVADSGGIVERRADASCGIAVGSYDGNNFIAYNKVGPSRQIGISLGCGGNNDTALYSASNILSNYSFSNGVLTSDKMRYQIYTNGFAIVGSGKLTTIEYNTTLGLLGADGIGGGISGIYFSGQENKIRYNFGYHQIGRNEEYEQLPAYGIQGESADTNFENHTRDCELGYNTYEVSDAHADGMDPAALRFTSTRDNMWVHHNRFLAHDSVGDNHARGFSYGGEKLHLGDPVHNITGVLFHDNYIYGDDHCITFYGANCDINGASFRDDTLATRSTPLGTFATWSIERTDEIYDSNGVFINCTDNDIDFAVDGWMRQIWLLYVKCQNQGGDPIAGVYVRAVDNYYPSTDSSVSAITDAQGYAILRLPEYQDDYDVGEDSTFTPYIIHADSANVTKIDCTGVAVTAICTLMVEYAGGLNKNFQMDASSNASFGFRGIENEKNMDSHRGRIGPVYDNVDRYRE